MDEHRTVRVVVYLTPAEARALRRRAGTRPLSTYLRRLSLGKRPGGAEHADDWWHAFTPLRKEQIHEFLGDGGKAHARPSVHGEEPFPALEALPR